MVPSSNCHMKTIHPYTVEVLLIGTPETDRHEQTRADPDQATTEVRVISGYTVPVIPPASFGCTTVR